MASWKGHLTDLKTSTELCLNHKSTFNIITSWYIRLILLIFKYKRTFLYVYVHVLFKYILKGFIKYFNWKDLRIWQSCAETGQSLRIYNVRNAWSLSLANVGRGSITFWRFI